MYKGTKNSIQVSEQVFIFLFTNIFMFMLFFRAAAQINRIAIIRLMLVLEQILAVLFSLRPPLSHKSINYNFVMYLIAKFHFAKKSCKKLENLPCTFYKHFVDLNESACVVILTNAYEYKLKK